MAIEMEQAVNHIEGALPLWTVPAFAGLADCEHLTRIVPLIERGGCVDALIALQADQLGLVHRGVQARDVGQIGLAGQLGTTVAESYAKSARWLTAIERGYAIQLGPDGSTTSYMSAPPPKK